MVTAKVRMLGILSDASGRTEAVLKFPAAVDVGEVVKKLTVEHGLRLGDVETDSTLQNHLPSVLILLNGVEIGNLNGLSTPVEDGDELVLISVTHGG